jgi:hypothetical protein
MTPLCRRSHFNKFLLTSAASTLAPFNIARAQSAKLKIGVLLPKSGVQGLIGQSCQKGTDAINNYSIPGASFVNYVSIKGMAECLDFRRAGLTKRL